MGSSPLARGLHQGGDLGTIAPGIIPARAGFTLAWRLPSWSLRDHPRSRGVYVQVTGAAFDPKGSSPLARGLRYPKRPEYRGPGIIPARAGFTKGNGWRYRRHRDHPRSRGVYAMRSSLLTVATGSSPLARGLPKSPLCIHTSPTDHPRSRGVYAGKMIPAASRAGSSPLARGLPNR